MGIGKNDFWNSLILGKSGIGPITKFNTDEFNVKIAAEVKNFNSKDFLNKKRSKTNG